MTEHSVRYHTRRFYDEKGGVAQPIINFAALGLSRFVVYIALKSGTRPSHARLTHGLSALPEILSCHELSGEFEYEVQFHLERRADPRACITRVRSALPFGLGDKHVVAPLSAIHFGRKYASPAAPVLPLAATPALVDPVDRKILRHLLAGAFHGACSLARSLALPEQAVHRRIERLQARDMIIGWRYAMPGSAPARNRSRLLLSFRRMNRRLQDALFMFALNTPQVTELIRAGAGWDYELHCECFGRFELLELRDRLYTSFRSDMRSLRILDVVCEVPLTRRCRERVRAGEARRIS